MEYKMWLAMFYQVCVLMGKLTLNRVAAQLELILDESLTCYIIADGKWNPAANAPVCSSFSRSSWDTSARVPPVCL